MHGPVKCTQGSVVVPRSIDWGDAPANTALQEDHRQRKSTKDPASQAEHPRNTAPAKAKVADPNVTETDTKTGCHTAPTAATANTRTPQQPMRPLQQYGGPQH